MTKKKILTSGHKKSPESNMCKVLSIKNPISYLVASGIKDVENRTWKTDYRGWIYIHSSGDRRYILPQLEAWPEVIANIDKYDKKKTKSTPWYVERYEALIKTIEAFYGVDDIAPEEIQKDVVKRQKDELFLKPTQIIGRAWLADIVKDSKSPFAVEGQHHWIFEDAQLFRRPITQIHGKLGLYEMDIPFVYLEAGNILQ
jgi:hypothetical protein